MDAAADFITKVGLTEDCFADLTKIKRLGDVDLICNGPILQLTNKLTLRDAYKVCLHLASSSVKPLTHSTFRKRVKSLEEFVQKLRKNKSQTARIKDFLEEYFNFQVEVRLVETPRKKKLREEKKRKKEEYDKSLGVIKKLKTDLDELELWNREQEIWMDIEMETLAEELGEDSVLALEERVGEAEKEISTKRQELEKKKKELTVYKKRTAGLKSRMATKQKKVLEMKEIPTKTVSKGTQTEISDVKKDLLLIEKKVSKDIFDGIKYFGFNQDKEKRRGVIESYARLTSFDPNSSVCQKSLRARARTLFDIIGVISGNSNDEEEKHLLIVKLIGMYKLFFQRATEEAGCMQRGKFQCQMPST